jgi:hypothetical protein
MEAGVSYIRVVSLRTAQKTPLPLLRYLTLPGKHRVRWQRMLYCRLTHVLPASGCFSTSTCLALSKYATLTTAT